MSNLSYIRPPIETAVGPVIVAFVSGMYSIVTVLGFLFNTVIILTIAKSKHLHTAMNSHLLGLAISDLIVCLVVIPCRLVLYTGSHSPDSREARCKLDVFMKTTCDCIEFSMLVGMSYERYKSVSKPFDKHNTNRRTVLTVLLSWIFSFGVGAITCIKFGDSVTIFPCYRQYSFYTRVPLMKFSEAFITLPLCVICLALIVMYYYQMIQTLKHHNTKLRNNAKVAPIVDHKEQTHAFTVENKLAVASPDLTTNITKLTHSFVETGLEETVSRPIKSTTSPLHAPPHSKTSKYDIAFQSESENKEHSHADLLKPDNQPAHLPPVYDDSHREPVKVHVFTRPSIKRTNSESKFTDKITWRRIIHENNVGKDMRPKSTKSSHNVLDLVDGKPNLKSDSNLQSMIIESISDNLPKMNESLKSNSDEFTNIRCDSSLKTPCRETNQLNPDTTPCRENLLRNQDTTPESSIENSHTIGTKSAKLIVENVSLSKATNTDTLSTNYCQENDKQTRLLTPLKNSNEKKYEEERQISQTSSSASSHDELLQKTLTEGRNKNDGIITPSVNVSELNRSVQNIDVNCRENNTLTINTLDKVNSNGSIKQTTDDKLFNKTCITDISRQMTSGPEITSKVDVVEMDGTVHKNVAVEGAVVGAVCVMNKSNRLQGRRRVEMRAAKRIAILIGSFVLLWLPLPLTSLYLSSEKQTAPPDLETLLVTGSISALTGAFNPIFNLLLNKQLRSASIRVLKGGIKSCTRFA